MPRLPLKGLYWTVVPLALAVMSIVLFLISATLLGAWTAGWTALLLLLLLSFETFLLPYLLLPLAVRLPRFLPWVDFNPDKDFGIDGPGRWPQRILISAMILLPGMPIISAYAPGPHNYLTMPATLFVAGQFTVMVFVILTAVLAIPDFGAKPTNS